MPLSLHVTQFTIQSSLDSFLLICGIIPLKALDPVSHSSLLHTLNRLHQPTSQTFTLILTHTQLIMNIPNYSVNVGNHICHPHPFWTTQGSILGLLLFILSISGMPPLSQHTPLTKLSMLTTSFSFATLTLTNF